ncbi:MAG: hypothetical protein JOZ79_02305 [Sphingomonas sp.]|nr:hypothetical protein [Sphingomonas sp.]
MSVKGLSILVLEDEPIIALTTEDLLIDAGADPTTVSTIADAEDALMARSFDLALLDVNVGQTNSYAVATALKARGIRFIFATGYGDALHGDAFAGVPTITKPYDLADIESAFASIQD